MMAGRQDGMATLPPSGYGSTSGLPPAYEDYLHGPAQAVTRKTQLLRRRWNHSGFLIAVLLPWAIFAGVLAVVSFPIRDKTGVVGANQLCYVLCGLLLAVVAVFGFFALVSWRKRLNSSFQEPTWYSFIFLASLLSWLLGIALGVVNYTTNMAPYFAITDLNYYASVDPAVNDGKEVMDAGRLTFTNNSYVDTSMSESFRDGSIYCVAPIVSGTRPLARYDFWAVGMNCCTDHSPSFHCGQFADPFAKSGVRLFGDTRMYTLALKGAKAAFGIKSDYPIFVEWVVDPNLNAEALQGDGVRFYLLWTFLHLGFQFLIVTACAAALWYLGW